MLLRDMPLDLLAVARDVIAVDSRSSVSDRPLVDLLLPLCRAAGLQASLQEERRDGERQYNLVGRRPGSRAPEPALLLNSASRHGAARRPRALDSLRRTTVRADLRAMACCTGSASPTSSSTSSASCSPSSACGSAAARVRSCSPAPTAKRRGAGEPSCWRDTLRPQPMPWRSSASRPGFAPAWRTRDTWRSVVKASAPPRAGGRRARAGASASKVWRRTRRSRARAVRPTIDCLDALTQLAAEPGFRLLALDGGDLVNRVATHAVAVVSLEGRPDPALTGPAAVEPAEAPASPARGSSPGRPVARGARLDQAPEGPAAGRCRRGLRPAVEHAEQRAAAPRRRQPHARDRRPQAARERPAGSDRGPHRPAPSGDAPDSDCDASVETELDSPPFAALPESQVAAALSAALTARGLPVVPELKSGTTEASVYAAAGIDTVVFGPGQAGGNIHRPERVRARLGAGGGRPDLRRRHPPALHSLISRPPTGETKVTVSPSRSA